MKSEGSRVRLRDDQFVLPIPSGAAWNDFVGARLVVAWIDGSLAVNNLSFLRQHFLVTGSQVPTLPTGFAKAKTRNGRQTGSTQSLMICSLSNGPHRGNKERLGGSFGRRCGDEDNDDDDAPALFLPPIISSGDGGLVETVRRPMKATRSGRPRKKYSWKKDPLSGPITNRVNP